jgi:hypothetical protein
MKPNVKVKLYITFDHNYIICFKKMLKTKKLFMFSLITGTSSLLSY